METRFPEENKIHEILICWLPEENIVTATYLKPIVERAIQNGSTEIQQLYPNNRIIPSSENAKRWKKLHGYRRCHRALGQQDFLVNYGQGGFSRHCIPGQQAIIRQSYNIIPPFDPLPGRRLKKRKVGLAVSCWAFKLAVKKDKASRNPIGVGLHGVPYLSLNN